MKKEFVLDVAGTRVLLLAAKALYWPARQSLCVADVHFGKAAAYRALGQPVPHGTTADNLARLDLLLAAYPCRELVFLGDFLHARGARSAATLAMLHHWRQRHPDLLCTLVRGNHDLRAGDPPPELDIRIVDEPLLMAPLALRHIPGAHAAHHVIAGHEHPVFRLIGKGRQEVRLPCFHTTAHMTVLPSFGDFTGGHAISVGSDSRIVVTDGNGVWPVPIAPFFE